MKKHPTPYRCVRCHTPIKPKDLTYWVQESSPILIDGEWTDTFKSRIDKPLCGPACAATVKGNINMGIFDKQKEFWDKFPSALNTPIKLIGIGAVILLVVMFVL